MLINYPATLPGPSPHPNPAHMHDWQQQWVGKESTSPSPHPQEDLSLGVLPSRGQAPMWVAQRPSKGDMGRFSFKKLAGASEHPSA